MANAVTLVQHYVSVTAQLESSCLCPLAEAMTRVEALFLSIPLLFKVLLHSQTSICSRGECSIGFGFPLLRLYASQISSLAYRLSWII
jgi:hypothetical protein